MKLLKPNWVSHEGNPIFSIDIHPDESRFATGGQGDGGCSGRVIIWNMGPVVSAEKEKDESVPKLLCLMDNHLACVNSVRWSGNGRNLASGGDDGLIMIWQFAGYGSAAAFGTSVKSSGLAGERWRCVYTLKGHGGDVLDLSWSPSDQWLASCSIDNTIVIWNAEKFPTITVVLKGHTSLVKGVTWDPVGTYLASQSDDRTVRIWRTLDWKQESIVSEPFEECGATTHVLRLSWSPDGGYLVSAHAMNNRGPTAQIIERNGWSTNMDFVGHRKAITCTRFNRCLFRAHASKGKPESENKQYTCCAVGSRDRSVSVWLTSLRRPLVVIHDLFDDSVMDLSWSYSGLRMLCCSWDGSVAYMEFSPEEIGTALSDDETNEYFRSIYGKASTVSSHPLIIENPAMLAIQKRKMEEAKNSISTIKENKPPPQHPKSQQEVRTSTGKRRIVPVFVAAQDEIGGVPCPFGSTSSFGSFNMTSNSSASRSVWKIMLEKTPKKNLADNSKSSKSLESSFSKVTDCMSNIKSPPKNEPIKKTSPIKPKVNETDKIKQALDTRLSERTKITSTSLNGDDKSSKITTKETSLQSSFSETETFNKSKPHIEAMPIAVRKVEKPAPVTSQAQKKAGRPSGSGLNVKRKATEEAEPTTQTSAKQQKRQRKEQKQHAATTLPATIFPKPAHVSNTQVEVPSLPKRKLQRIVSAQIALSKSGTSMEIRINNELTTSVNGQLIPRPSALQKIVCLKKDDTVWESVLSNPAVTASISHQVVCVACHDQTVLFFSTKSGSQFLPCIRMDSPIAETRCLGTKAMVVLSSAKVYSWDVKIKKALTANTSFLHLLPLPPKSNQQMKQKSQNRSTENHEDDVESEAIPSPLQSCRILANGMPLLTFTNGTTYAFDKDLCSWTLINSAHSPLDIHASYKAYVSDTHLVSNGILSLLQKHASGAGARALQMYNSSSHMQKNATLSFLEQKVHSCIAVSSLSEYRFWLLTYVRYLVEEGLEGRLRELCNEMLGPSHITNNTESCQWQPFVIGISKRTLLSEEILPLIGSNLNFQRLYTEFQDQLDIISF